jgi:hypothetical protein
VAGLLDLDASPELVDFGGFDLKHSSDLPRHSLTRNRAPSFDQEDRARRNGCLPSKLSNAQQTFGSEFS